MNRISFIIDAFIGILLCCAAAAVGDAQQPKQNLQQPVFRIAKNNGNNTAQRLAPKHPLDQALEVAHGCLKHIQTDIKDYTALLIRRETVNKELKPMEYTFVKIRNRKTHNGKIVVPFGLYMKVLKGPNSRKGSEAIWVEGANDGKILAHGGRRVEKLIGMIPLEPKSNIARQNTNYYIWDTGIEELTKKLIQRANNERKFPECEVQMSKDAKINGRSCTLIQLVHPVKRPQFEFHIAHVFVDNEYNVPIRYAAYDWPTQPGAKPQIIEEFTYLNLKLNPGLTAADFNYKNPAYDYRR